MLRIVPYTGAYRDAWNRLATRHGTLFHTIEWKEVLESAFGYRGLYLLAMDGDQVVGLLPIITGRDLFAQRVGVGVPFTTHLDVCAINEAAHAFILEQLHTIPCTYGLKRLEVRLMSGEVSGASLNDENYTFELPLHDGEERLLERCSASRRNNIRKVYRREEFSVSFDAAHLPEFYAVFRRRQKQLGASAPDIGFFAKIQEKFPHHTVILTVRDNVTGQVVGGGFLMASGNTLYCKWMGSLIEHSRRHLSDYIYWEGIRYGIEHGFAIMDLGRSLYEPHQAGTYAYKARFGARPVPLRYYRFGVNLGPRWSSGENRHRHILELWRRLPAPLTDTIGRHLVKHAVLV